MVKTTNPDLIILDIMLPKIDGFKVCELLKNDPKTSGIPIVMLTAKDSPEDINTAKKCKADGYIRKPFESELLLYDIANLLKKK